jgi:hypothetical protein
MPTVPHKCLFFTVSCTRKLALHCTLKHQAPICTIQFQQIFSENMDTMTIVKGTQA